jgi:D-galacturonate reductase
LNSALKLEYLDLYLVHWPLKFTSEGMRLPKIGELQPLDIPKTWKAMEKCVELGLAKAIGVSNFSSKKILDLLQTARIRPTVNQVCYLEADIRHIDTNPHE